MAVRFDAEQRWLVLERPRTTLACNLSGAARRVPVPPGQRLLLASREQASLVGAEALLPPESAVVLGE